VRRHATRLPERHHAGTLPRQRGGGGMAGAARVPERSVRRPMAGRGALGVRGNEREGLRFLEEPATRMSERLDPAKTCLLLFDFLVGHVARDPKRYVPVLANTAKLVAAARERGAMVAYARADHR